MRQGLQLIKVDGAFRRRGFRARQGRRGGKAQQQQQQQQALSLSLEAARGRRERRAARTRAGRKTPRCCHSLRAHQRRTALAIISQQCSGRVPVPVA